MQKIGNVEEPENEVVNNLKKSNPNKFLRCVYISHSGTTQYTCMYHILLSYQMI